MAFSGVQSPACLVKICHSVYAFSFSVIGKCLLSEFEKGRVAGPFSISPLQLLIGIIPNKYQPGKWRLTLNLSSLAGHSVNNGIPQCGT